MGVEVQLAASEQAELPREAQFAQWVELALQNEDGELCLRVVDAEEGLALNRDWRGRTSATNVLSFPSDLSVPGLRHLGDVVVCAPVVLREAAEQGKRAVDHFAHLTIHGVLHLRGFDHIEPIDAQVMERLEVELLNDIGLPNPYEADNQTTTTAAHVSQR